MTADPPDCSQNRRQFLSCLTLSCPFLSNTIPAEALCSGVRLDIFLLLPFCFFFHSLSRGVGREASKAQRVRRVRPQDDLFYGFFCACSFVLLFLSGRPVVGGTWLRVLSWGN